MLNPAKEIQSNYSQVIGTKKELQLFFIVMKPQTIASKISTSNHFMMKSFKNDFLSEFDYFLIICHIFLLFEKKGIKDVAKVTLVQNVRVVTTTLLIGPLRNMEDPDNILAQIVIFLQNK